MAISLLAAVPAPYKAETTSIVLHSDLWGRREQKYETLLRSCVASLTESKLTPSADRFYFAPKNIGVDGGTYQRYISLRSAFVEVATGFETARDHFAIAFTEKDLKERLDILAGNQTDQVVRDEFGLDDKRDWELPSARRRVKQLKDRCGDIRQIAYRPFDCRFTHYDDIIVTWPRKKNLGYICHLNPALIASRMIKGEVPNHFFVVEQPPEKIFISGKTSNNAFVFPLFRSPQGKQEVLDRKIVWESNFSPEFVKLVTYRLKREFQVIGDALNRDAVSAETVFGYIYAIMHSKTYREQYAEELKIDFPRIPVTSDGQLFDALSSLGSQLANLHLAASQGDANRFWSVLRERRLPTAGSKPEWFGNDFGVAPGYPKWSDGSIWINETTGLADVPSNVWQSMVGGYQVAQKWLKDRRGRRLTKNERDHFALVLLALESTIAFARGIENCIALHGG